MSDPSIPFARYREGGRQLLGIPGQGDVTARHGYGPPVFRECGFTCAYCGFDMGATYQTWLQISVDHVIPHSSLARGYPREWIEDLVNLVTCCRSCNEFMNAYSVSNPVPVSDEAFFELRDRHFLAKRALALAAHERERSWHTTHGLVRSETVPELMARYGALLRELRTRGVTRTDNNPVSDYAEALVARAFSLQRGHGATRGYDAIDADGILYQVKARRLSPIYNNRQLGTIRGLDQDLFDILVGVLFDEDFAIRRAAAIPIAVVRDRARAVGYVNGATFYLNDDVWLVPGVKDLTADLQKAAAEWIGTEDRAVGGGLSTAIVSRIKGNAMAKYGPLQEHLTRLAAPVRMSFSEIDRLVGGLPQSARTYREWWANHANNPQAKAWLGAGRHVESIDVGRETVEFA